MINGNGDIAQILNDRNGACFFARGVSNSSCVDADEFKREQTELFKMPTDQCLFYFSSISAATKNTPYFEHKKNMESLIKQHWKNYVIIRIGNIDWGNNPKTFLNYINSRIKLGLPVHIQHEHRYLISKKQLLLITDNMPLNGQHEINVFGRLVWVPDLFKQL